MRVTLNKNFSKGNLMSSKLFESSNTNNIKYSNNLSVNNNFPKIKNLIIPDLEGKRDSSPLSENESMKPIQNVKTKKIAIDDRKTNSNSQNKKEEINNLKVEIYLKLEFKG